MEQELPQASRPQCTLRALGLLMLAFVVAFQPAFALAGSASGQGSCGAEVAQAQVQTPSCCCPAPAGSEELLEGQGGARVGRVPCSCRAVPAPAPFTARIALATTGGDPRLCAVNLDATLKRSSIPIAPWTDFLGAEGEALPPPKWRMAGAFAGAWVLDRGGVPSLLALYSIARI